MRCVCCDRVLSDYEATRKFRESSHYVDMCGRCFRTIEDQVAVTVRSDLASDDAEEKSFDDLIEEDDYE